MANKKKKKAADNGKGTKPVEDSPVEGSAEQAKADGEEQQTPEESAEPDFECMFVLGRLRNGQVIVNTQVAGANAHHQPTRAEIFQLCTQTAADMQSAMSAGALMAAMDQAVKNRVQIAKPGGGMFDKRNIPPGKGGRRPK